MEAAGGSGGPRRGSGVGGQLCSVAPLQVRSECPLGQLLAREAALGREIRALDSDMQTLLYENYNKFISATGEHPAGETQASGRDWGGTLGS